MKFCLAAVAVLPAIVMAVPASAGVTAEADVAHAEGDWGGEISAGMPLISDGGFSLTPSVGAFFHHHDHPGYDVVSSQCIDQSSGAQVSDGKCDSSGTKIFGKVEAVYRLPTSLGFGVGARFIGSHLRAYGTVAMPILPHIDVKGNLGDHYVAAGLQARF